MELHMQPHHWEQRSPDWIAAAVAGFVAGAALMMLDLLWSTAIGVSPWITSHRIAAVVMGSQALQDINSFNLWIVAGSLVVHYVLGILFGMLMAAVIAPFRFDSSTGMVLIVGVVFGFALYLLNFYGMVLFFPWFADMRGWATLIAHLVFGMVAAYLYLKLEWTWTGMQERIS